ncbi:alpha-rhamnosidase [Bacteroides sp. 214]|uniref:family 78 glycoside hydrolase catalytic domain n=1 Tax=Bacteroides sp. 214 TaxID=2302935 RepID=UPI0013D0ECE4|nr:family 78 glycoside hydrolase catalytic domain [Bacteroides sp. 214]NDW12217.1 alpha-rhamnosidase [Bacteroides sp. 214]
MKNRLVTLLIITCLCIFAKASVSVSSLQVEQLTNPIGIDTEQPRLSWKITSDKQNVMQTAYHLLVASSLEKLVNDEGDLWDSGRITSNASHLVAYNGKPMRSNQRCYWKVKVYTTQGDANWSEPAMWSMGLLGETHWRGQWIGMDAPAPWDRETTWSRLSARYLRTEFNAKKQIKQATVHICGLGLYELYINGTQVGDQVLAPLPTDYRKTVLYNSFDVTSLLTSSADNAIGVTLGNGRFYTMRQNYKPYKIPNFGYPKLRLNLIIEYTDGTSQTIASDTTWKLTADGPIRSNNEYDGEEYDANKELTGWATVGYDDKNWQPAQRVSIPDGTLRAGMSPNMKVVDKVKPISINKLGNKYIIDMGQNFAGWIRMKVKGQAGDSIKLRFAEQLQESGELYVRNLRDARVTDTYIVSGKEPKGTEWAPRFVYHGFRYVEVVGYDNPTLNDFIGEVVSDEMPINGSFNSSNEILNKIHKNAYWGILSNYKGMPVDCPQRNERQPWLGDHAMGSWGESFIFGCGNLFDKWMDDIRDVQREDGCIPDVVPPYFNYYSDNMTWPATFLIGCDMLYTQYGNISPIRKNYPAMKRWLEHMMKEYMKDYIMTKDKYGDWCVPPESLELIHSKDPMRRTDGNLIATAYTYKMLDFMVRFARLQGFNEDIIRYEGLQAKVKEAFNNRFLQVKAGTSQYPGHELFPDSTFYDNNTVTANILPLAFGMVPEQYKEEVEKNVIATIITTNGGHISTGVIGTQWLMHQLSAMGRADVAYLLATQKSYPSWGYMVQQGATTIWELWNGNTANPEMNSANHVMLLGDLISWSYENLGGIRSSREQVGFKHIVFAPDFDIQELSHASVTYETPYGKAVSNWSKTPTQLKWEVTVPANTTAEVHLPGGKVEQIGSGTYHYNVAIPTRNKAILTDEFLYEQASFPECHASTIIELANGDLVTAYFGGTKERNPDCVIWVSRKVKGSNTWTAPVKAADGDNCRETPGPVACWNPVLFQIPGKKEIILFYKVGLNVQDWDGYLVRSKDNGKTWSKRERLPDGILGPIKNKPEFINGRIICPTSREGSPRWRFCFEISDDLGKTWRLVGPIPTEEALLTANQLKPDAKSDGIYCIQPSILKHKDGRLQVLGRTRNGQLATSWSSDNGDTWSTVSLTNLPNNNSGTDAVTLKDGRHVLIYNDFRTIPGTPKGPRTPLNIAISEDGINWKMLLTLEDSPISQYSYPSIIQGRDGMIHVVYTWRRQRIKYAKIDPTLLK